MADIVITTQDGAELAVRSGNLFFPYRGAGTAHVILAEAPDSLPSGRVTLRWHGLDWSGALLRIGTSEGETSALMVAGAGGLSTILDAKYYANQPQVRLIVQEILSAAGESLSATSTTSVLSQTLPSWPRRQDQAGALLDAVAKALGVVWRVLPDGSVFVGTDDFAQAQAVEDTDYQLLSSEPEWLEQVIAPLTARLPLPGEAFSPAGLGGAVARVHLEDDGDEYVARIWYLGDGATDDPVIAGQLDLIRQETRGAGFHPQLSGKIVQQRGDGTVDVQLDDPSWPTLTSRPYLVPIPGAALDISPGDRCWVAFPGGDPTQPYVQLYESGQGTKPLGIDGDQVPAGTIAFVVTPPVPPSLNGTLAITHTDAFGNTQVITLTITGLAGTSMTFNLKGKLTGSAKLKHP